MSTHIAFSNESGQVYVAGPNTNGQLSLGTTTQTNTFTLAKLDPSTNMTSVLSATDGSAHSLFLRSTGYVYSCGANANGQLGLGTTIDASYGVLVQASAGVDLSNVVAVAAGAFHTAFVLTDGSVVACGLNTNGQLGDGSTTQRTYPVGVFKTVSARLDPVASISTGVSHTIFSTREGTVWGCGLNTSGQIGDGTTTARSYATQSKIDAVTNITNVGQVAAGDFHSLALTRSGTVYAWGANAAGQLATGNTTVPTYPSLCLSIANIVLSNIAQVAAGAAHSLFLTTTGTVFSCGSNTAGQLSDGTLVNKLYPVQVLLAAGQPLTQVAWVYATANQSYFLGRDGAIYAAGFNGTGAFGNGTTTSSSYAIQVFTANATSLKAMGYSASYARRRGATIANLQTAGFTTLEIVCAGYTKTELTAASIAIQTIRTAGASYRQLIAAGYTETELLAAGYVSPTIRPSTM